MSNSSLPKKTKTSKVSKDLGIKSNIQEVETVADISKIIQGPKKSKGPSIPNLGTKDSGIIGAKSADRKDQPKPAEKKKELTVALFSTKNVSWEGVGKILRGYNIVTEEEAEKWLTRSHVRLATPKEVAQELG
jgi:hypothetical protein